MTVTRGTSNTNVRGNTEARRRRRAWLVETYAADVRLLRLGSLVFDIRPGEPRWEDAEPACRCYRCGCLLTVDTVTCDRIVPGCKKTKRYPKGGTYVRENIRPCCGTCNSRTGQVLSIENRRAKTTTKRTRQAESAPKPSKGTAGTRERLTEPNLPGLGHSTTTRRRTA